MESRGVRRAWCGSLLLLLAIGCAPAEDGSLDHDGTRDATLSDVIADALVDVTPDVLRDIPRAGEDSFGANDVSETDTVALVDGADGDTTESQVGEFEVNFVPFAPPAYQPTDCAPETGWCSISPWAKAEHMSGVAAVTADDIWLGGSRGSVARFHEGSVETLMRLEGNPILRNVWATGPLDVWFSGMSEGVSFLLRWDGVGFERAELPGVVLRNVWHATSDNLWAVSAHEVVRWDGSRWTAEQIAEDVRLEDVWGSGADDVWVIGTHQEHSSSNRCRIFRWDGTAWRDESRWCANDRLVQMDCKRIWGTAPDDVWLAGTGMAQELYHGGYVARWDGQCWTSTIADLPAHEMVMKSITGSGPDDVWAVTHRELYHWDGDTWTTARPVGARAPHDLAVAPNGSAVLSADNGGLYRRDAGSWTELSLPTPDLKAAATGAAGLWVTGSHGAALHYEDGTWTHEEVGTRATLNAVWLAPDGQPWVVGDSGAAYRRSDSGFQPLGLDTEMHLSGVWGRDADDVWVVGGTTTRAGSHDPAPAGYVAHWDGTTWTEVAAPEGGALLAVTGSLGGSLWVAGNIAPPHARVADGWVPAAIPYEFDAFVEYGHDLKYDATGRLWVSGKSVPRGDESWSGFVATFADDEWSVFENGIHNAVTGVWSDGHSLAIGAGDGMSVWLDSGDGWRQEEPGLGILTDVVGTAQGHVYLVGNGGQVLKRVFPMATLRRPPGSSPE